MGRSTNTSSRGLAWLRAVVFALVAVAGMSARAAMVGGLCTAGWSPGAALQGASTLVSSVLGGLLGAASGIRNALGGGGTSGAGGVDCMPAEPASLPLAGPAALVGNPVDLVQGVKLDRAVDVHLPAPASAAGLAVPVELLFTRLYASQGLGSQALGPGWRHGLETRLHAAPDAQGQRQLQILQADGRLLRFGPARPGPGGVRRHQALIRDDGVLDAVGVPGASPMAVHWIWRWRDGRRLGFDAAGRLLGIEAEAGRLVLEYADADGPLVSLADGQGRRLRLRYAGTGRLAAIELPDGTRVGYGYDGAGRLSEVRMPTGEVVRYRYEEGPGARLAAVILPDGRESAYRYDAAGRAVLTRAAGEPDDRALELRYRMPAHDGDEGETRVSRGGRLLGLYRWRSAGDDGPPVLLVAQGPGCEACPATGVRYYYSHGRLAAVERGGRRWQLAYDPRGRLAGVHGEGGFTVAWSPNAVVDRPRQVLRPSTVAGRLHRIAFEHDAGGALVAIRESGHAPVLALRDGRVQVSGARPIQRVHRFDPAGDAGPVLAAEQGGPLVLPTGALATGHGTWEWRAANGARTRYWTDDFGRVVALQSPDSGLTRWERDGAGRVLVERLADGTVARQRHDAQGRLVEHAVGQRSGASSVTRLRFHAGRLAQVEHPLQSESLAYDLQGRLLERLVRLRLADGGMVAYRTQHRHPGPGIGRGAGAGAGAGAGPLARSLPDGSWLHYLRDARGQVVGLARSREGPDGERTLLVDGLAQRPRGLHAGRFGNGASFHVDAIGSPDTLRVCHRTRPGRTSEAADPEMPLRSTDAAAGVAPGGACDLLDHRLHFDAAGRLRSWSRGNVGATHLYDVDHRLLQTVERGPDGTRIWRQAYDANGNRLLAQEPAPAWALASDAAAAEADAVPAAAPAFVLPVTAAMPARAEGPAFASNRVLAGTSADVAARPAWDAAGRLLDDGRRRYRWNAAGLLAEVTDARGRRLAAYRYDYRGLRIAAWSEEGWRYFLFDEHRRPLAELDHRGRLQRQYVYLADIPIAVIDRDADPLTGSKGDPGPERITYLHLDHRGTPVLATDEAAQPLWRASLAPFGRAQTTSSRDHFSLALRLPGQYEDVATGLHYNDHRWYDPDAGRYLSPDPLGLRGGPNPYAYAGNDPLTRVDPSGLLLFAFDGTGNSDPPAARDDWSNVYKLARSYADGRVWYMAGVGRNDAASGIRGGAIDLVDARSARERVDFMLTELSRAVADPAASGRWLDVDVIGFSRGAAMARDFANRVSERIGAGTYDRLGACVRLRFLGLWDTVAQFGAGGILDAAWKLSIPDAVGWTAHAVALNEHRTLFPAESIMGTTSRGVRIERGFVGAHSDVGGSYAEGDLSDVSLGWMHAQALQAGVRMFALTSEFARVTSPLLHDSDTDRKGDREFRYRNTYGITTLSYVQRMAPVPGLAWRDTAQFISRFDSPRADAYGEPTLVGMVDMRSYGQWLSQHYGFEVGWTP